MRLKRPFTFETLAYVCNVSVLYVVDPHSEGKLSLCGVHNGSRFISLYAGNAEDHSKIGWTILMYCLHFLLGLINCLVVFSCSRILLLMFTDVSEQKNSKNVNLY